MNRYFQKIKKKSRGPEIAKYIVIRNKVGRIILYNIKAKYIAIVIDSIFWWKDDNIDQWSRNRPIYSIEF